MGRLAMDGSDRASMADARRTSGRVRARRRSGVWLEELERRIAPAVITAFTPRFSVNDTGDILFTANTLLTAPASDPGAAAAQAGVGTRLNDNNFSMAYVDVDGDASTFNSSRADLRLPAGSTVLFAGLYWGADSSSAARNQALLQTPASGGYLPIAGTVIGANNADYQAFADVTGLVRAAESGTYGVANVQASTGSDKHAGWALVVAYRDPAATPRNLTVFDGFAVVQSSPSSDRDVDIPISGFRTPLSGPVNARIGVVAYEGDRGSTGDSLRFNGSVLSDSENPGDNFFNSSISHLGSTVTSTTPNYVNQLGFDAVIVQAPAGAISNGATSGTVTLHTGGETYFPGVVTTAVDLFAPRLQSTKSVTDLDGGFTIQGDLLEYTVTVRNTGGDDAANVSLIDAIPTNTAYVPGSLEVVSGANAGAKSDGNGDDQAELDVVNNRVVFRLGTGASLASGGALAIGETTMIRFRVQVNAGAPNSTTIANQAEISAAGAAGGFTVTSSSSEARVVIPPAADLVVTKSVGDPTPDAGDVSTFTVTLTNSGPTDSAGVQVSDPLPTGLVFVDAAPSQGTYDSANGLWDVGALANGQAVTLVLRARATTFLPLANVASVTASAVPDPDPANNSARVTVSAPVTDLAVAKTVDDAAPFVGDRVVFTLSVLNGGRDVATGAVVQDRLPAGLTFISAGGDGTYDPATGRWTLGSLAPGATAQLRITARVTNLTPGLNVAALQGLDQFDAVPENDSANVGLAPQAPPTADLGVSQAVSDSTPSLGETVVVTTTLTNQGPDAATGVAARIELPDSLSPLTIRPSRGTFDPSTGIWTIPQLEPGRSSTLTITALVTGTGTSNSSATILTSGRADPDDANNSASAAVTVASPLPPPSVASLVRVGVHRQPTRLVLRFTEALDPARALDLSNYRLVLVAHGGRLRRPVALRNASYDPVNRTVTLHPARLLPLRWQYSLTVRGGSPRGVTGTTGLGLDGNGDGRPGGDYVQTFGREILVRGIPLRRGAKGARHLAGQRTDPGRPDDFRRTGFDLPPSAIGRQLGNRRSRSVTPRTPAGY